MACIVFEGLKQRDVFLVNIFFTGFPLELENLENGKAFSSQGKSQGILNRLEKSAKSQGKSHKILENSGNSRKILFVIFSDI